jgi:ABC-type polysaccharide/polyol phosphate export permease
VITNAGFFLAPVIYPLDIVPERLHRFLYLWPPTSVMEFARAALIGTALPTARGHLLFVVMALGCLLAGVGIYRRLVPAVAEHL